MSFTVYGWYMAVKTLSLYLYKNDKYVIQQLCSLESSNLVEYSE